MVEKVQSVVNYLVETVAVGDEYKEIKYEKKATRVWNVRNKHTAVFKAKVIHQVQPDVSQDEIAHIYGISQSLVSKWLKNKDSIIAAAAEKHRKLYAKQRKSTNYLEMYRLLFDQLKTFHDKGRKVIFNWQWSKARSIQRDLIGGDKVIVRKHVIAAFLRKYNVRMCARQCNRSKPKEAFRADLMKWHSTVREQLVRMCAGSEAYDAKWGSFLPFQRFNVDQSPIPFVVDSKKAYEIFRP